MKERKILSRSLKQATSTFQNRQTRRMTDVLALGDLGGRIGRVVSELSMAPLCYPPPPPPESFLRVRLKSERVPLLYKTHLRFARIPWTEFPPRVSVWHTACSEI